MYSLWILWCFVSGGFVGVCCAKYDLHWGVVVNGAVVVMVFNTLLYLTLINQ